MKLQSTAVHAVAPVSMNNDHQTGPIESVSQTASSCG